MPGSKQTMSNKRTYLPRWAKQKVTEAAEAATHVLNGVEVQPGKMIIDIYIDFEKNKPCDQIMRKVKPNFKARGGKNRGSTCIGRHRGQHDSPFVVKCEVS